uniref:Uncharacterized protein n=1 Tax=Setaria italica TaxID=4555 RepID=K3ZYK8_SETIT
MSSTSSLFYLNLTQHFQATLLRLPGEARCYPSVCFGSPRRIQMLSRLPRAGLQALNRARPGQNSVPSRSHEVEAISTYMIRAVS